MGIRLRKSKGNHFIEEPSVNLTPLIDVVFSILIMFIVIAPLLELDKVELAEANPDPENGISAVKEGGPIAIHVHEDNSIWLNQRSVELTHLSELLRSEKLRHPGAKPQVYHDKRASFGTYQSIKNAAERAGFAEMDIILKPA
jgi:biopolymer transport protein ExbD